MLAAPKGRPVFGLCCYTNRIYSVVTPAQIGLFYCRFYFEKVTSTYLQGPERKIKVQAALLRGTVQFYSKFPTKYT